MVSVPEHQRLGSDAVEDGLELLGLRRINLARINVLNRSKR
jgi:hypothetical protein